MIKYKKIIIRNFLSIGNAPQEIQLDDYSLTLILGNNLDILNTSISSLKLASIKYKKSFDVVFYSSSEIYNSFINEFDPEIASIKIHSPRSLYSEVKLLGETWLTSLKHENPNMIGSLIFFKPYNISGANQMRGVIYEMISSAINDKKIWYSADTTRTITSLDYASKLAAQYIEENKSGSYDIIEKNNAVYIKSLAKGIKHILKQKLNIDVSLVQCQSDKNIQYRNIIKADAHLREFQLELRKIVFDILKYGKFTSK
jgi:nucleoside-diphosphate-sugar epimerase